MKVLDKVGQWKHYFWTNDKGIIPESVKWMEESGYIVREISELKSYDDTMKEAFKVYIEGNLMVGAAADFVK